MIESLRPLTQDERQDAYDAAQDAVIRSIGPRPERSQFTQHAENPFPPAVTRLITVLCLMLLAAAFTPSAIRLYTIGSKTFGQTISNTAAVRLVGLATVLSAETGQVVFSLALATLGTTRSERNLLYTSALIATLIALVGNVQLALPGHTGSPFAWFEAIAPPLLVLSTSYVLKGQMLDSIQHRHANEQAYKQALNEWQDRTRAVEDHPRWSQFYANAIRDLLRKKNSRRKESLNNMTVADWRAAVYRELRAESWYEEPSPERAKAAGQPVPFSPVAVSSNGNGYH